MTLGNIRKTVVCACLFPASLLFAGDDTEPAIRRPSIGIRVESFPLRLFDLTGSQNSTANPIADYTYTGGSNSPKIGGGPTVEYRLTDHWSLGAELQFHHAQYQQTTVMLSGKPDPNSSTDDRRPTTITDTTKANYWDFPLLAHYYGLRPRGWLSRTYVSGGLEFRHVGRVRTGNEFSYADGVTDYNETPDKPNRANQFGFVVGVGLRFIDEFHIKVTPEIRYIRWAGATFQGQTYHSVLNQFEGGLGLSF